MEGVGSLNDNLEWNFLLTTICDMGKKIIFMLGY